MARRGIGARVANSRFGRAVSRGVERVRNSRVGLAVRRAANRIGNALTGRRNLQLAGRIGRNRAINSMGVRSGN